MEDHLFLYCAFKKKKLEFFVFPSKFFLHIKHNWLQIVQLSLQEKKKDVYLLSCSGLNVFVFLFKGDKPELTKSNLGKKSKLNKNWWGNSKLFLVCLLEGKFIRRPHMSWFQKAYHQWRRTAEFFFFCAVMQKGPEKELSAVVLCFWEITFCLFVDLHVTSTALLWARLWVSQSHLVTKCWVTRRQPQSQ